MEIPGYQYDPKKKRYFKILKTGELPDSPYTVSALASSARRKERERKAEYARESAFESQLSDPLEDQSRNWSSNKIGTKLQTFLRGRSAEHVTCFALIECGQNQWNASARTFSSRYAPIVGYRDGVLATLGSKTESGRSIVAVEHDESTGTVVAAVDNAYGSVIVMADEVRARVPRAFVSAVAVRNQLAFAASTKGLTICSANRPPETVLTGSLSSVAYRGGRVACGSKDGKVQLFDVTRSETSHLYTFPNQRAVTNLAITNTGLVVATGLEDHMYLLDSRIKGSECMIKQYEYSNWSHMRHGFSFAPHSSSEFAVAQENSVVIYSMAGGVQARIPTTNMTAPCLRWNDEGLFIGMKNSIKLVSKRRMTPRNASENIDAIHKNLNESDPSNCSFKQKSIQN